MEFTFGFIDLFLWAIFLVFPLLLLFVFTIVILGLIVCRIESWNCFDAIYWAFITATTVGYGDIRPLHKRSKVLSIIIALIGMMLTGIIVSATLYTASSSIEKYGNKAIVEQIRERSETNASH